MSEHMKAMKLDENDLEQVVGGMGMDNRFEDLENDQCKCLKCGAIMHFSQASIHDAECFVPNFNENI